MTDKNGEIKVAMIPVIAVSTSEPGLHSLGAFVDSSAIIICTIQARRSVCPLGGTFGML